MKRLPAADVIGQAVRFDRELAFYRVTGLYSGPRLSERCLQISTNFQGLTQTPPLRALLEKLELRLQQTIERAGTRGA